VRIALLVLVLLAVGCRPSPVPSGEPTPTDPDEALRAQISQGAFSLSAATESLADAKQRAANLDSKLPAQGEMREDWLDFTDYVDSCGSTIADFVDEPPPLAEFKRAVPAQKKRLKDMLEAATNSLQELYEAQGIVASLLEGPPKGLKADLESLAESLDSAAEDLTSAISALGGTPPAAPSAEEQ
jgi:hypothetical protein